MSVHITYLNVLILPKEEAMSAERLLVTLLVVPLSRVSHPLPL